MTNKTWKAWTPRDEDLVEVLRMDGKTLEEIAAALGRTVAAIRHQLLKMDAPKAPRRWKEWLAAFVDGAPNAVVAERMGVSLCVVKSTKTRLRKAGHDIISVLPLKGGKS